MTTTTTEKKIEDYLHLYGYGCAVMTPDGVGSIITIYPRVVEVGLNVIKYKQEMKGRKGGGEMHYKYFYPDLKLILRPLSSMNEEEAKELMLIRYSIRNTLQSVRINHRGIHYSTSGFLGDGFLEFESINANQFHYLLSKHFDIYKLIDAGLAIEPPVY